MMDSFSEDSVPQQTEIDPTINEINEDPIDEEGIYLGDPRGPDDEISTDPIDVNDPDEIVAEKSIAGKFNSFLSMGKTRKQGPAGQNTGDTQPKSNRFKNVLSFGKFGNPENNLNESSTDAVEENNPDGLQDPNNEENDLGGIQPKTSFFDGIKNALPFGKTPGQTGLNERSTGTPGGPNQVRSAANGTSWTQQQEGTDFAIISGGFNNKKTLANGLMDFAFLTANANQLYYAVASRNSGNERIVSIVLISTSILLQIVAGILLICTSYIQSKPVPTNDNNQQDAATTNTEDAAELYIRRRTRWLNLIDHWTIALVFIIAITNIFIAAFSTTATSTPDNNP
ncbi:hypothetical protein GHT06_015966 [Daphnia sinensis]|uniref:Ninjurin a n=1 Tax=Daphnia sinensis TaxID=1820382 RepID=A0AAD5KU77_9CRUS|nr:hypothetical protein GHT06_015966 [Daphnia sinensis]